MTETSGEYKIDREIWPDELPDTFEFIDGERPLHEYVRSHAVNRPDMPALTFGSNTLSWKEVDQQVETFAKHLVDRGYKKRDVCALHVQNCPQFVVAYYGAQRAGMVITPLNPQYKAPALKHQLQDNGARIIVTHPDVIEPVRKVKSETSIEEVVTVRYSDYLSEINGSLHPVVDDKSADVGDTTPFEELTRGDVDGVTLPDTSVDDLALLQYTGGTTGLPKGCKHTHWNILFKATNTHLVYQYEPEETHLAVMPIFHVGGKTIHIDAPAITGNQVVFLPRYTPESVITAVDDHEVTFSYFTVPMINEILDHDAAMEHDLTSLSDHRGVTYVSSLGSNLTQSISDRWRSATGCRLQETAYGMTETHTMDTHTVGLDRIEPEKGVFTGQFTYGGEIEIRSFETNEPLERGEEGEVVIRTPSLMEGYLGRPEETEEILEEDGFLHTGDIGRLTERDLLYFLGRQKDIIKVSGHTVAPREIESILENNSQIEDVVAVGKSHSTRGSVIEAHIIPADDSLTEADVFLLAEEKLAEYKRPKSVVFIDDFPRTDVGKVDRVAFRETLPERYE